MAILPLRGVDAPVLTAKQAVTAIVRLLFAIPILLFSLACISHAAAAQFTGKVIAVADGDSITVFHDDQPVSIRLNGIDAPEFGQAFSSRARQFVSDQAFGHSVIVVVHGIDDYGRTIGDVMLPDGRILNREVVRAGFAWWFRRYSTDQSLGALEEEARAAKRGLWADPHAVPPWEWRQAQREVPRGSGGAPAVTPRATGAGPVIGNKRSGIYHRPDCPNYADVAPGNQVPFGSPAEAEAAGYRLARNCP